MTHTLLVARLWFEGNRFACRPSTLADFEQREWARGDEALAAAAGTATELGAVAEFAHRTADWRVFASRCASATPGGPIDETLFERWLREVLADAATQRPDAVFLSLHGAAITTARDRPDLDLLRAMREHIGPEVPMGASFDLHANLPAAIVEPLDFASGYRTYPHVDMRETAHRVIERLRAMVEARTPAAAADAARAGRDPGAIRPGGALAPTGLLLPSLNMRTDSDPMRALLAEARAIESRPGVLDVSVFGGFPYADTADTGASVMVWAGSTADAARHAAALAAELVRRAPGFEASLRAPRDGLRAAAGRRDAIVAVTDPADNPLSGGAADTPGLFAALLAERRDPASPVHAFPAGRIVFAFFADAATVQAARRAGIGARIDVALGATASAAYGAPVPASATVLRLTDGTFANTGPMERGSLVKLGPTAVLDVEGIAVIVTAAIGAANDPGFFALHGIDLQPPLLLVVKAKNHFRAAFAALCADIVDVDCPGPAALDLRTLPLRRAGATGSSRPKP